MPAVSVIVPTHNRAALLNAHLHALAEQTYPRTATEWVVVCDGCSDNSAQVARMAGADQVIEQAASGAAAARNTGLQAASGEKVLFLDDDIIPTPGWVDALLNDMAEGEPELLHMGYCPYAPSAIRSYLDRRNAAWYEAKLRPLMDPTHAWRFTDFFGGNFGAGRRELQRLGGFDIRFTLFEDAELALRALTAGWRIRLVLAARAQHHAHREVAEYGRQAYRSGQADVLFARVHPEAATSLRIGIRRPWLKRGAGVIWRAVSRRTALATELVERGAGVAERLSLRPVLDILYPLIWDSEYWRGVATA